jgi:two-component system chemotaxis response regulator CheB
VARHDIVVIGASSGGVEVLTEIVAGLPRDFPAAVFVVLHVRADVPSFLPGILNRAGRLPVAHAVDEEPIRLGRVYVAPPGFQTYLHLGRLSVRRGPRENAHRPAIDPLFRTAAHFYGPRVVGVVLTGAMDDGSAGLLAIKRGGGIAVVQDPVDAMFSGMPTSALAVVEADLLLKAGEIATGLVDLVSSDSPVGFMPAEVPLETAEESPARGVALRSEELGPPSAFVCPECSGTLYEIDEGPLLRFRCRVGHAYTEEAMASAQDRSVERALWTALRALEERSALFMKLADFSRRRGHEAMVQMYEKKAREIETDVKTLHELISTGRTLEPMSQNAS